MLGRGIHILALDVNRGQEEGQEDEKIVSFFGAFGEEARGATAGLVEGLLSFSSSLDELDRDLDRELDRDLDRELDRDLDGEAGASDGLGGRHHHDAASLIDVGDAFWVTTRLSWHPNIIICIMIDKKYASKHVTERNLLGLAKLFDDMVLLLGFSRLDDVVQHVGKRLGNPLSWLRLQLRNPFSLTYGASRVRLPADIEASLHGVAKHYGVKFGLWHGGLCVFTSFISFSSENASASDAWWLRILGSFVLGEGMALLEAAADDALVLFGQEVGVMRGGEYCVFVIVLDEHDQESGIGGFDKIETRNCVAQEAIRIVSDFAESAGGWQAVDTRHVPGSRYCVEHVDSSEIICSPRGKVSSSSHLVRSQATALIDSIDWTNSVADTDTIHKQHGVYTCNKTGDIWGCYNCDRTFRGVSVTLGGLQRLDVVAASRAHRACLDNSEDGAKSHRGQRDDV